MAIKQKTKPNPYYPYRSEEEERIHKAVQELRLIYGSTEDADLKDLISEAFDPLVSIQDLIDEKLTKKDEEDGNQDID